MKIVHLCLLSVYADNYSYQDNLLPKFHKKMGYEVEIITTLTTFDKNGKIAFLEKGSVHQNEYDIKVTRLDYKKPEKVYRRLRRYIGTYATLEKAKPDILFIHGCQFMDMDVVVKYIKKHDGIRVYVDNHADFSNSGTNWLSKNILHKVLWRHMAHIVEPYTAKFYGVLPARVDWLVNMYKVPKDKCELLVMGADDEEVMAAHSVEGKKNIRQMYGIDEDDFLIMTGGKIDPWKTQTLLLMEAVLKINNPKVKLIVFGSVTPELKDKVNEKCELNKVQYIGWLNSSESYKHFAAADLVVFPGRHSVFWEQVAGIGKPMLCKFWDGTTHVDLGGNVEFLKEDSVCEIQKKIEELLEQPEKYEKMKAVAVEKGMKIFSYKQIAESALN